MGKMRMHRAYLSISASGPLLNDDVRPTLYDMRPRALAELAYTTADVDFLEKHWATENYDTAPQELHKRLKNPSISEFRRAIEDIKCWFAQFYDNEDWDGGCITFSYAGHGREADGALVLEDGDIEWDDFLEALQTLVPDDNEHRLRVNILLDSCYSGAFLTEIHYAMRSQYEDKFYPYYSAAACLFDEVAREYRSLGHGLFTYCFSIRGETPDSIVARAIQPDNTFGPSLSIVSGPYGCSFLTQGAQNPIIIDGDELSICGKKIDLYDDGDNLISKQDLYTKMREFRANFRYLFSGFNFPNGARYGGRITNDDIKKHLVKQKELYEFQRKIEAEEAAKKNANSGTH